MKLYLNFEGVVINCKNQCLVTTLWKIVSLFKKDLNSKDSVFHNFVLGSGSFVLVRLWVYRWCLRCSRSRGETVGWSVGSTTAKRKWSHRLDDDIWWKLWLNLVEDWLFSLFMEEEEEAGTVRETGERAVVDVDLLRNCLLGEKTGQGDRDRIQIRSWAQRWQRGTGTSLVNKGRKGRKSPRN